MRVSDETSSILGQIFLKTLHPLRTIGCAPVAFEHLSQEPNIRKSKYEKNKYLHYSQYKFRFTWFSWLSLYSFLTQVIYYLSGLYTTYQVISGNSRVSHYLIAYSSEESGVPIQDINKTVKEDPEDFGDKVMAAYVAQYYILGVFIYLTSFWTAMDLATLLNNWTTLYATKFSKAFVHSEIILTQNFKEFYDKLSQRLKYLLIGLTPCLIGFSYVISNCLNIYGRKMVYCTEYDIWVTRLSVFFAPLVMLLITVELVMIGVVTRIVVLAMTQINNRLKQCTEILNWKDVFNLIIFVRRQYKLVEKICGPAQLALSAFYFTSSVTNWIIVLWLLKDDMLVSMVVISLGLSVMQIFTFWLLVTTNERILQIEKEILNSLRSSKTKPGTLALITMMVLWINVFQMEMFINYVTIKPSEYTLCKVIKFKRVLQFTVLNSCTTYVIAILQLADVSNSEVLSTLSSSEDK